MQYEEVIFQGKRSNIDELVAALKLIDEVSDVEVYSVESVTAGLLGREPLNQVELVDIILGIAINLASSVIYDQIRHKINEQARKKGFTPRTGEIKKRQR